MCLLIGSVLVLSPVCLYALDNQADEDLSFSTDAPSAEELEGAEEMPLELDPVSVEGMGMEFKQEVALRIVRQAYRAGRSERQADKDKWICWLDKPVGTHFKYLSCARNGDLEALRPDSMNPLGSPATKVVTAKFCVPPGRSTGQSLRPRCGHCRAQMNLIRSLYPW